MYSFFIDGNFHVKAKAPTKTAAVQARCGFLWIWNLNLCNDSWIGQQRWYFFGIFLHFRNDIKPMLPPMTLSFVLNSSREFAVTRKEQKTPEKGSRCGKVFVGIGVIEWRYVVFGIELLHSISWCGGCRWKKSGEPVETSKNPKLLVPSQLVTAGFLPSTVITISVFFRSAFGKADFSIT